MMKKIALRVDTLAVESFATMAVDEGRGSVEAHEVRTYPRDLCKTILTACPCTPRADEV